MLPPVWRDYEAVDPVKSVAKKGGNKYKNTKIQLEWHKGLFWFHSSVFFSLTNSKAVYPLGQSEERLQTGLDTCAGLQ